MCMEDVEIGRRVIGADGSTSIPNNVATLLLQGNAHRFALLISRPMAANLTIGFGRQPSIIGDGITLGPSSTTVKLTLQEMGEIICRPIYVIQNSGGTSLIGWLESSLYEGMKIEKPTDRTTPIHVKPST